MPTAILIGKTTEEKHEKQKETQDRPIRDKPLEKRIATEQGKRIVIVSPYEIFNGFLAAENQRLLINPRIDIIRYAHSPNPPYFDVREKELFSPPPFFIIDSGQIISSCGIPLEFHEYRKWAKAHKVPCLAPKKSIVEELGKPMLKERANHIYDLLNFASVKAIQHDLRKATMHNFDNLQAFRLY